MKRLQTALATALALTALAGEGRAGMGVEQELTCPIGGEVFSVLETTSCSSNGFSRTMSFRPITTCDFVTRLPVCPSNGLPLYREFSDEELPQIEALMQSRFWSEIQESSPWRRAYELEGALREPGTAESFNLLLSMFWYDTEAFLADPVSQQLLIEELEIELERVEPSEEPFLLAITGYALVAAGRSDRAFDYVQQARENLGQATVESREFLGAYLAQIESCVSRMEDEDCRPEAPFVP